MLSRDHGGTFAAERLAPLSEDLEAEFRDICTRALREVRGRTQVPYSSGRKPDSYEVATIGLSDVSPLVAALAPFESYGDLTIFSLDGDLAKHVALYIVGVDVETRIFFVRSTSSRKRLKRTNRIAAIWRGQAFETLEDDPLLFDAALDAVVNDGIVYILNQPSFERSLGFLEEARRTAEKTVRSAISALTIANTDDFVNAVRSDLNMISKTRSIAKRLEDPGYAKRMTIANLAAVSERHPEIDLDWQTNESGERELVFYADPQRRWKLLKLLDDDFVQSLVTELVYETNSKHQLD